MGCYASMLGERLRFLFCGYFQEILDRIGLGQARRMPGLRGLHPSQRGCRTSPRGGNTGRGGAERGVVTLGSIGRISRFWKQDSGSSQNNYFLIFALIAPTCSCSCNTSSTTISIRGCCWRWGEGETERQSHTRWRWRLCGVVGCGVM